jgi:membrane fusion protein, multidrug efflux system
MMRVLGRLSGATMGLLLLACGGGDAPAPAAGAGAGAATGAAAGAPGGGGRGGPMLVLSAGDVHTMATGTLELTTPLAGDLRPIEEVTVRARLDGDLLRVAVREGDAVRAGALLAEFDGTEVEAAYAAAQADVAAATAEAGTADWNATQAQELFRAGAIAEQERRAAEQTALAARARLAAAEARERSAALARRDARVTAPTTGTVGQRLVQPGERVSRGAALFTVVRDDSLELAAAVPARAAGSVRVGQAVRFLADGRTLEGRIARVSPTVDPSSRAVTVYVRLGNADRALRANTFANGRIVAGTRADVLLLPREALRQGQAAGTSFVYRLEGDVVAVVPVQVGETDEAAGTIEVREGLAAGDRVIVGNVGTVGRGMRVQLLDGDRGAAAR